MDRLSATLTAMAGWVDKSAYSLAWRTVARCWARYPSKNFIAQGSNALIVANALAHLATVQGYDVRYLEADTEFARYALAPSQDLANLLREWVKPVLLTVDDLFLARRITAQAAKVFATVVRLALPATVPVGFSQCRTPSTP